VPASLAYLNVAPQPGARPTNPVAYAGIAAGPDRASAEASALEEVLERDATTIWWASGSPAPAAAGAGAVVARLDDPSGPERRVTLLNVPSELPVPVVAAFVEDTTDGLVAFGSACRATAAEAAEKALVEAYSLLSITAKLTDPDSDVWRAVAGGAIGAHTYAPYRLDRSYRDAFQPDWRDMVDLPALAQLYLDPRMQGRPLDRLRHPAGSVPIGELPAVDGEPPAGRRDAYVALLAERGLRAFSVDLTTADVAAAGLAVVRVVVPGLYGNAPPAYPYRGGARIYTVPSRGGWPRQPRSEDELVTDPLPLA